MGTRRRTNRWCGRRSWRKIARVVAGTEALLSVDPDRRYKRFGLVKSIEKGREDPGPDGFLFIIPLDGDLLFDIALFGFGCYDFDIGKGGHREDVVDVAVGEEEDISSAVRIAFPSPSGIRPRYR